MAQQQNKVAVNLAQDFTDAQQAQGRANIGASQVKYDNAVTDMTVTKEIVRPYMNTKYSATIGSDDFLLLPSIFADGMVVKSNGSLQTQAIPTGLPVVTQYSASFGNGWTSMRQVDSSISSGAIIRDVTLSTPIQLTAGKKYLISPVGLFGNIEQTKTASETSNVSYSMRIYLWDSSKAMVYNETAVIIGEAEIANHNVASIGQYPPVNGIYRGSFAPTDAIITPAQDLSLDTLRVSNGGNIDFGFSSSSPATLVMDHRITGINVMQVQ